MIGVLVGLAGSIALIFAGAAINPNQEYIYASLPLIASVCYAINVNIIKSKLQDVSPMAIAVGNFAFLMVPAILVLIFSDFFTEKALSNPDLDISLLYLGILAVVGTGIAKIMFNKLVQITSPVFATSVTYTIPLVAFLWGTIDGEQFSAWQIVATIVILFGVFLVNKDKKTARK